MRGCFLVTETHHGTDYYSKYNIQMLQVNVNIYLHVNNFFLIVWQRIIVRCDTDFFINKGVKYRKIFMKYNLNRNATKRPLGHLDVSVGKQYKRRKIMQ